jgi:hypothetical protein
MRLQRPAKFFQADQSQTKENQGKPRKKSLDFLGFLRPNRAFSMGYGDRQRENSFSPFSSPPASARSARFDPATALR